VATPDARGSDPAYRRAMTVTEPLPELRDQALERLKKQQDLRAHVLVFVMFNTLVWTIWALTGSGFPWPVFITGGWGIGVVMNAWDAYWRRPITESAVQREIERLRQD
jgi:hypothetical protein